LIIVCITEGAVGIARATPTLDFALANRPRIAVNNLEGGTK
jgi:hypothetical protein